VALFEDVARYVYGTADDHSVESTKIAARNAAIAGWDISTVTNIRTQEKGFVISDEHFDLIDKNRKLVKRWPGRRAMNPKTVEKAGAK